MQTEGREVADGPVRPSVCLSVGLSVCLSVCQSVCLFSFTTSYTHCFLLGRSVRAGPVGVTVQRYRSLQAVMNCCDVFSQEHIRTPLTASCSAKVLTKDD